MTRKLIDTIGTVTAEGPQALRDYLRSLYWLCMAADVLKGRNLDADVRRHGRPGSQTLTRPLAGGRYDQEISWLKRQTRDIETYLDNPTYVHPPVKAKRRCAGCKRGLSKSWVYCPMCGEGTISSS
jgi:hypothetical protein